MDEQLKNNLTSSKHWVRFLYMILFAFFLYIASFFMVILVAVQFVFALLTGAENTKLRVFGRELTLYIHQMLMFLTYNTDFKPFPFADWPGESATAVVPERDPVHEQDPAQARGRPVAPRTATAATAGHTTAADAEVESPTGIEPEPTSDTLVEPVEPVEPESDAPAGSKSDPLVGLKSDTDVDPASDTESTEVTAATSLIDVEPAADVADPNTASPVAGPASQADLDGGDLPEDIPPEAPEPAGTTTKTTRTRKKPE